MKLTKKVFDSVVDFLREPEVPCLGLFVAELPWLPILKALPQVVDQIAGHDLFKPSLTARYSYVLMRTSW
jgi:hypothetical protein